MHQRMVRSFDHCPLNAGMLRRDKQPCFCVADFACDGVHYDIEENPTITTADTFRLLC